MPLTKPAQFDRSGATTIDVNRGVEPRRAIYFYRVSNDNCITEFCVVNHCGPNSVESYDTDRKTLHKWACYEEGDLLVFKAPDQTHAGQPLQWAYDRRLQLGVMATRHEMDKFILRGRVSAVVQGLRVASAR